MNVLQQQLRSQYQFLLILILSILLLSCSNDDQDAKTVFWHSSAHMMGEALENLYGCKLTIGPPLAGGFYYDSYMGKDAFREEDCKYFPAFLFV